MNLKISYPFLHLILLSLPVITSVTGHIDTPCQHLVVHNFTPCFNLVTGSSANGSSPTAECCSELNKLSRSDIDCACLLLIGTIPARLTFLRSLQVVLPRSCNVSGVPLQCKGYGAPLPAPGPGYWSLDQPPPPEAVASSPRGSSAAISPGAAPTPVAETPGPAAGHRIQPVLNPASDAYPSSKAAIYMLWCLIAIVAGLTGC
uniref:Bifunctional inhibitor/plant lipid transfer protein/seed storage helical domain-containing protein n=1 Tax=Kalanchoe fedtschenkoi TaxID=63787 RepID=A0A7N0T3I5_KALFE